MNTEETLTRKHYRLTSDGLGWHIEQLNPATQKRESNWSHKASYTGSEKGLKQAMHRLMMLESVGVRNMTSLSNACREIETVADRIIANLQQEPTP